MDFYGQTNTKSQVSRRGMASGSRGSCSIEKIFCWCQFLFLGLHLLWPLQHHLCQILTHCHIDTKAFSIAKTGSTAEGCASIDGGLQQTDTRAARSHRSARKDPGTTQNLLEQKRCCQVAVSVPELKG